MARLKGLYLLRSDVYERVYTEFERAAIAELVDISAPPQTSDSVLSHPAILEDIDVIFSSWGMPQLDETLLAHASRLKMIFYGAGSIRGFVTDAMWQRGIRVTSAYAANAIPVAEYTLAAVLFSLRNTWRLATQVKQQRCYPQSLGVPGSYGRTVGIISLGMVGRLVCERLRPFDMRLIAYDPFASEDVAARLGVTLVSLEELFRTSDVVSLHTPLTEQTRGMITREHLALLKSGATFINTARGAVVREPEMIAVLSERPDLQAVLDVTYPEPPEESSPLYALPNVFLTPHIAGAIGSEQRRLGQYMVDELRRYLAGEALRWEITEQQVEHMAMP